MLEKVGCPVVMGNAAEELKKRFTRYTADHNHDGIAEFLEAIR